VLQIIEKFGAVIARRYNISKYIDLTHEAIFRLGMKQGRLLRKIIIRLYPKIYGSQWRLNVYFYWISWNFRKNQ